MTELQHQIFFYLNSTLAIGFFGHAAFKCFETRRKHQKALEKMKKYMDENYVSSDEEQDEMKVDADSDYDDNYTMVAPNG